MKTVCGTKIHMLFLLVRRKVYLQIVTGGPEGGENSENITIEYEGYSILILARRMQLIVLEPGLQSWFTP